MGFSSTPLHSGKVYSFWNWNRMRIKSSTKYQSLIFIGILLCLSSAANGSPSERRAKDLRHAHNEQYRNFSISAEESSSSNSVKAAHSFTPSASLEEPVFTSRGHSHPHHLHEEFPPGLEAPGPGPTVGPHPDKIAKSRFDSKGLSIDKSPPELQFGLSFTVPFISLSTDRLLQTLSGKSAYGHDPYSEVASLLKLNVGGLVVAALVGVAALLFVPTLFPGKLPGIFSHGFPGGFMPGFLDQIMPGLGLNKPFGYGQYDHAYDPYTGDYSGSSAAYNIHRNEDARARSSRRGNETSAYTEIVSTVQRAVHKYWGEVETCAEHAMCLRGKLDVEEKKKLADELQRQRNSRRLEDSNVVPTHHDEAAISSFEHILDAIQGMKGITRNMPIFHQLHKAFKSGQGGSDCSSEYKKCPVTADKINQVINNMGNYIFNS